MPSAVLVVHDLPESTTGFRWVRCRDMSFQLVQLVMIVRGGQLGIGAFSWHTRELEDLSHGS